MISYGDIHGLNFTGDLQDCFDVVEDCLTPAMCCSVTPRISESPADMTSLELLPSYKTFFLDLNFNNTGKTLAPKRTSSTAAIPRVLRGVLQRLAKSQLLTEARTNTIVAYDPGQSRCQLYHWRHCKLLNGLYVSPGFLSWGGLGGA